MHQERLIAIDTIILSSESTLSPSKLAQHSLGEKMMKPFGHVMNYDKHFTFKQLPLLNSSRLRKGAVKICYDAKARSEFLTLSNRQRQRKTLIREGRNLCAINCLSLKSYLISTAECISTRYRDNKGMKRLG